MSCASRRATRAGVRAHDRTHPDQRERFVDFGEFIGKATVARRDQAEPLSMVLVYCEIEDGDSDLLENEPVYGAAGN